MMCMTCRNVTLPYLTTKRECRQQEVSRPLCRVEYETQNYTTQARKCNEVSVEDCFSIAIPQYNVVSASRCMLTLSYSSQGSPGFPRNCLPVSCGDISFKKS